MAIFFSVFAAVLITAGIILTIQTGFFQFTHLGKSIKTALGFSKKGRETARKKAVGEVTAFQALATALGGSIGTANIAGVSSAIALGGAGAVFWMWVAALVGMATKFSEIVLALSYRERDKNGGYSGGPMHYIEKGLLKKGALSRRIAKPLAILFAVFGLLSSILGTSLIQSNTIAMSFVDTALVFNASYSGFGIQILSGIVTSLLVGIVIIGGVKRIGRISEIVVPFMAIGYVAICCVVLFIFRENIGAVFSDILRSAFGLRPMAGGAVGYSFIASVRVGVARGVYSNEAGVGSASIAHACASTTDPVKQGMYGIFEVFADTIVMCTLTALVVLVSGITVPYGSSAISGTSIALDAFSTIFPRGAASVFLSVSMLLFAYTSILGWSVYGMKCASYLYGAKSHLPYCMLYLILIVVGAVMQVGIVWKLGEALNYLMACPNIIALLLLSGTVRRQVREYRRFELKTIKK